MKNSNKQLTWKRRYCFDEWDKKTIEAAYDFSDEYKDFLSNNKTEREVVRCISEILNKNGFKKISFGSKADSKWEKLFLVNRDKALIAARKGKKSIKEGVKIIAAHIDSPRLDLKLNPLYENEHLAYLKTHFYGGIKTYQWVTIPLEIRGVVALENGKSVEVQIGTKEEEPIMMITDLLPHLSEKQLEKKLGEAIEGENLNLLVGSSSDVESDENKVKHNILKLLNEKYGINEEDLISADLEIVPSSKCRDLGLDKSMLAGYGHDDRVCAWSAFKAFLEVEEPEKTTILVLLDREEIGSYGNTGATSSFSKDFIANIVTAESNMSDENTLRDILAVSEAISADVTAAFDPHYPEVSDTITAVRMGAGVVMEKYTGGRGKGYTNEASAEYLAKIRKIWNGSGIIWQAASGVGKVDFRGGGTVAMFFAEHNIDVIDVGVALFNMHAPFEIVHKGDLYSAYLAYQEFLR